MIIPITEAMRKKSYNFSKNIIKRGDQYNRVPSPDDMRVQRTYAGKLAECVFLEYIRKNFDSNYPEGDMFKIYSGETNVDNFDFETINNKKIDIKTAYLPIHKMIMIPKDQLDKMPKDFYIGIKLNGDFLKNKPEKLEWGSIEEGKIIGGISYNNVLSYRTSNWGSNCKAVPLKSLSNIKKFNFKF